MYKTIVCCAIVEEVSYRRQVIKQWRPLSGGNYNNFYVFNCLHKGREEAKFFQFFICYKKNFFLFKFLSTIVDELR